MTYTLEFEYPINLRSRYGYGKPPHPELYAIIDKNRSQYNEILHSFMKYHKYFLEISLNGESRIYPYWNNCYLPGLDSIALYGFLSINDPALYVEVGSGNSTKFARSAIKSQNLQTKIISIDPQPRAEVDPLCDEVIRQPLEEADLSIFDKLRSGDILFIDGSHRLFMGSDVAVTFLEIIPRLPSGVLIEFHDIFLPYDYAPEWAKYYYSEQYMLAAFLLAESPKVEVLLPNAFISSDLELQKVLNPIWQSIPGIEPYGASFWIKWR